MVVVEEITKLLCAKIIESDDDEVVDLLPH
jgi:hypothetical protein